MTDDARERERAERPEALALARLLRKARRAPAVRYLCPHGGAGGRGGCTMLEVYTTPSGPLWFAPAMKRSPAQAETDGLPAQRPESAGWLTTVRAASGGGFLHQVAACRHHIASLHVDRIEADLQAARGPVVLDREASGARWFV